MASSGTKAVKVRVDAHNAMDRLVVDNPKLPQAVALAAQGYSYRQIAQALGWKNQSTPHRLLERYNELAALLEAADVTHKVLNECRGIDAAVTRLWQVVDRCWKDADAANPDRVGFDPKAVNEAFRTMNQLVQTKAKLLGMFAPERVDVSHNVSGLAAWQQAMASGEIKTPSDLTDDGPLGPQKPSPDGNGAERPPGTLQ